MRRCWPPGCSRAFGYGAANVIPTFGAVPLEVRLTSPLITVFGNIPLHAHFRRWAPGAVPDGHAEISQRWELFHTLRTLTALAAFALIVAIAVVPGRRVGSISRTDGS